MIRRKNLKEKGKLQLSKYFQEFKIGEKVAIVREQALNPAFPKRAQGKSGLIEGKRGKAYLVRLMDGNMSKLYILKPAHLKKLK